MRLSRLSPSVGISLGLALLTVSVLVIAEWIGLMPDPNRSAMDARKRFCESLAVQVSMAAGRSDYEAVRQTIVAVTSRNSDIRSVGLRSLDGELLINTENHAEYWGRQAGEYSTPTHAKVPIFNAGSRWGTLELRFEKFRRGVFGTGVSHFIATALFVGVMGFFLFLTFIKRTLRQLDPSSVVPKRVKRTLDALAEGVVLIDAKGQIVLANLAFAQKVGRPSSSLMGERLSKLPWVNARDAREEANFPWLDTIKEGRGIVGVPLFLSTPAAGTRTLVINSSVIQSPDGRVRGALVTFDDVTNIEEKNDQLQQMVLMLKRSRDDVDRKNKELRYLATRDPLTGCLNRRSFFEIFETELLIAQNSGAPLSCIMLDIDRFKSINDTHGHAMGDKVIQRVSDIVQEVVNDSDAVCRYGGEEFCVALRDVNESGAAEVAEEIRRRVASCNEFGFTVTSSFGVAQRQHELRDLAVLIDRADRALYAAKNGGRNRVVRWSQLSVRIEAVVS